MISLESPWEFDLRKKEGDVEVVFINEMEVSQGSPEVGDLMLNGEPMSGRYGGPVLIENGYLFVPIFIKKFCVASFRLVRINSKTFEYEYIGHFHDLIWLDRIENNKIYFFSDLKKTVLNSYNIQKL